MGNWKGYFFASLVTSGTSVIETPFPNKYIKAESWDSSPDQREELVAYRDDNSRDLHRITADGMKSTFAFSTRKNLNLEQKDEIMNFFKNAEVDTDQRKIHLKFWNDDISDYDTGYFYRPNMPFKILKVSDTDIWYDELALEFIEY